MWARNAERRACSIAVHRRIDTIRRTREHYQSLARLISYGRFPVERFGIHRIHRMERVDSAKGREREGEREKQVTCARAERFVFRALTRTLANRAWSGDFGGHVIRSDRRARFSPRISRQFSGCGVRMRACRNGGQRVHREGNI